MNAKEFENLCIFAMEGAERDGDATMSRYGVQGSFRDGQWQPIESLPDFEGVLSNGRQFIFDCKVCSQASFPLDDDKFKRRQLRHMLKRADFGAICFLLIHFTARELKTKTEPARTVALPVYREHPLWIAFDAAEVKRVGRDHCDEYGVDVDWVCPPGARKERPDLVTAIHEVAKTTEVTPDG